MARLAERSGVSRAMISKIERGESSPTAVVLGKLSAAFELSMSTLLSPGPAERCETDPADADHVAATPATGVVRRADATPAWTDPDTGYLRRQVSTPGFPVDVTEVTLPAGSRVPMPAAAYAFIAQLVWVLDGELTMVDGPDTHVLAPGDTFELGRPRPRKFANRTRSPCRYLVVVTRRATA